MVEPIEIKKTEDLKSYVLTFRCPLCSTKHTLTIKTEELFMIRQGSLISRVLAGYTPTQRDQFITGVCPKCQDMLYSFEDEDDDEDKQ